MLPITSLPDGSLMFVLARRWTHRIKLLW
jgi:hypothetical protein